MRKSSKIISSLLIGASLMSFSQQVFAVESKEVIKEKVLAGQSRYESAIAVSKEGWNSSENAVLVNGSALVDALSATPYAKMKKAPILLTEKANLTDATRKELLRLDVKNVTIVGGEGVVSEKVKKTLNDMGIKVERLSGENRFDTSIKVAKELDTKSVAVVNGLNGRLADAMSVAAPAAQNDMAIILTDGKNGEAAEKFIKDNKINNTYVVGGQAAISNDVKENLKAQRLGGKNRAETNAEVLKEFYNDKKLENIYVAKDGSKKESELVDALAAGPLAAEQKIPVMLLGNEVSSGQERFLSSKQINTLTKVGYGLSDRAIENIYDVLKVVRAIDVTTVTDLDKALKNVKNTDVVRFKPNADIVQDYVIKTFKEITVELDGKHSGKITIDMPNGDVINNGELKGKVIVENVKDGTFINKGKVENITVNDKDGASIVNMDKAIMSKVTVGEKVNLSVAGKIEEVIVDGKEVNLKIAKKSNIENVSVTEKVIGVKVENSGNIENVKIHKDAKKVKIDNLKGHIEKLEGNKSVVSGGIENIGTTTPSIGDSSGGSTGGAGIVVTPEIDKNLETATKLANEAIENLAKVTEITVENKAEVSKLLTEVNLKVKEYIDLKGKVADLKGYDNIEKVETLIKEFDKKQQEIKLNKYKNEFNKKIDSYKKENYTEESWKEFSGVVEEQKIVVDKALKESEVKNAITIVNEASNKLVANLDVVKKAANEANKAIENLAQYVKEVEKKEITEKNRENVEALVTKAKEKVKIYIELKGELEDYADIEKLENLIKAFDEKQEEKVKVEEAKIAFNKKIEFYKKENYTEESWKNFNKLVEEQKVLVEKASKGEEIKDAIKNVELAADTLVTKVFNAKTIANEVIAKLADYANKNKSITRDNRTEVEVLLANAKTKVNEYIKLEGNIDNLKNYRYIEQVEIKIKRLEDTVSPRIVLNGEFITYVDYGEEYVDEGVKVTDNVDDEVKVNVTYSHSFKDSYLEKIDTTKPGSYNINYEAVDSSGNKSSIRRKVNVRPMAPNVENIEIVNNSGANDLIRVTGINKNAIAFVYNSLTSINNIGSGSYHKGAFVNSNIEQLGKESGKIYISISENGVDSKRVEKEYMSEEENEKIIFNDIMNTTNVIEIRNVLERYKPFKDECGFYEDYLKIKEQKKNMLKNIKDIQNCVIYDTIFHRRFKMGAVAGVDDFDEEDAYDAIQYGKEIGFLKDINLEKYFENGYKKILIELTKIDREDTAALEAGEKKISTVENIQHYIIDMGAAKVIDDRISKLLNLSEIKKEDKETIDQIKKDFNELADRQKKLVQNYDKIIELENKLSKL
ncbi:MAG: cell wall-binding repeat-containing protein [Clostridium sp.]